MSAGHFRFERIAVEFDAFPLTLTLSPAEREQPLDIFLKFASRPAEVSRKFAKTLGTFLPLRWGAATAAMAGEGKRDLQKQSCNFSKQCFTFMSLVIEIIYDFSTNP